MGIIPTSLCEADYERDIWLRNRANWRARAEAMAPYALPGSYPSTIMRYVQFLCEARRNNPQRVLTDQYFDELEELERAAKKERRLWRRLLRQLYQFEQL
ncbi:unnamed protein product [Penicillium glandicola]